MATTAIYPGSFDPVTMGHLDIARRAAALFDELVVGVFDLPAKSLLFSTRERVAMAERALGSATNIRVQAFSGLLVDFAGAIGAQVIVRGVRGAADFEAETQMAQMNRHMSPTLDVVCLFSSPQYSFLSASLIKEIIRLGGPAEGFVPDFVIAAVRQKFGLSGDKGSALRGVST